MRLSLLFAFILLGASQVHGDPLPAQPDNGFVTEVHKDKVGTIVFAKSAAAVTTPEKPTEFTDAFKSTDTIFLRAYLPHSLNNAFRAQGVECADPFRSWLIEVDGKPIAVGKDPFFYQEKQEKDAFNKSTSVRYDKPINGKPDTNEESIWRAYHEHVAPTLQPGEHTIKLALRGACRPLNDKSTPRVYYTELATDLASGTFKITVAKGAAVSIMPKSERTDAKLVKEGTALLTKAWKEDQVLKVVIIAKDWTIELKTHNGREVPKRRFIDAAVAVKQAKGCRVFNIRFEQPAAGKKFGATEFSTGDSREVNCDALK